MGKKILLVGGGTAGHILPLLPLAHSFKKKGHTPILVHSANKIDHEIAKQNFKTYQTYSLQTPKIDRFISFRISKIYKRPKVQNNWLCIKRN